MRKHLLRTLGVSLLAALGLMAFAAAGAQASEVKVLGTSGLATGATVTGEQLGLGALKVGALNIEIVCSDLEVTNGHITNGATGEGLATILYLGCVVWSIKAGTLELIEVLKDCQILDSVNANKVGHITAEAQLKVILHNGDSYVLASPKAGKTTFAIVNFTSGIGCSLTLKQEIKGSTVFKVSKGDLALGGAEVTTAEIESNETIAALFGADVLKYGVNTAVVIGKADLKLSGAHTGCTWGVL